MNYFLLQYNKIHDHPKLVFFAACFVMILVGIIFMEKNFCQISSYLYSSHRLSGTDQLSLMCRIF